MMILGLLEKRHPNYPSMANAPKLEPIYPAKNEIEVKTYIPPKKRE